MAFDFATVENTAAKQEFNVVSPLAAPVAMSNGWAIAHPDQALALLFVAPADNGMIEEILAA
ncbi:MAG: hypothetical protein ABL957_15685 [Parvularculaceae bacterium]